MQLSPAPISTLAIVHQLVSSTSQLVHGADPQAIVADLSNSVSRWRSEHPPLEDSLRPISSLLPPAWGGDDEPPPSIRDAAPSLSREALARALRQTGLNLSPFSGAWERDLLEVMNKKLQSILRESRPPLLPGSLFSGNGRREISGEIIGRQMVQTMKTMIAGVTHDANNMLAAIIDRVDEAEEQLGNWYHLAQGNLHLFSEPAQSQIVRNYGTLKRNLKEIREFVHRTVSLVHKMQAEVKLSVIPSDNDLMTVPLLFMDGGMIHQVSNTLLDLMSGLYDAQSDLSAMRKFAETHGHLTTEASRAEGVKLRSGMAECLTTLHDFTAVMAALFRVLRSVTEGMEEGDEKPVDLSQHFNTRLIQAIMMKGTTVLFDLDHELWKIPGPAIYAWQIGLNLMVNARDAMDGDRRLARKSLTVTTRNEVLDAQAAANFRASLIRPEPRPGEYAVLEVKDTGPGIPENILPRIFDLSFSGKESSGLGLSVALTLIEGMKGFIAVDTVTEGAERGTAFRVYFPKTGDAAASDRPRTANGTGTIPAAEARSPTESDSPKAREAAAVEQSRPVSVNGNEVILIVDDETAILRATKRQLESRGYRVVTAERGEAAIRACKAWYGDSNNPAIALVLLDINMPGMETSEVLERLRAMEPRLACLFHTGGNVPDKFQGLPRSSYAEKAGPIAELIRRARLLLDDGQG